MINLKAPKDMTAPEFVQMIDDSDGKSGSPDSARLYTLSWLKKVLLEPAPNPFTPDQLAWMREEQRAGYHYAAKDECGCKCVCCYIEKPTRDEIRLMWKSCDYYKKNAKPFFLSRLLSWDDPEPLCFADYAPLEGAADV